MTALAACTTLAACGGGGGSSDTFVGAADASISTTPSTIDSGDRTEVSIELWNVHENGVMVKVRFPEGLKYVRSSAILLTSEDDTDISPTINDTSSDGDRYLVFFLSQAQFTTGGQDYSGETGTIALQLEGVTAVSDGLIEVDPDVDDPQQSNDAEFDIENPEFNAQAETSITVIGN